MIKRTKGRILLTLLVITGFAGTINNTAPTKQERRFVIDQLKDSKTDLSKYINGLSESQLNFKPSPGNWSVKERFYHLVLLEEGLWNELEKAMKEPANSEKRSSLKLSDDDLLKAITNQAEKTKSTNFFHHAKARWQSMNQAQSAFKVARMQRLKYVKTTTEDLRNRFIETTFGTVDCYQFILLVTAYSAQHTRQIGEIITNPGFPKN